MLRILYMSGTTGGQDEIVVDTMGRIVTPKEQAGERAIIGLYNQDDMFIRLDVVEKAIGEHNIPDTWQNMYLALEDEEIGSEVVFFEYIPSTEEVLEGIIRELNMADITDVNIYWLGSLGLSHNDALSALGLPTIKRETLI